MEPLDPTPRIVSRAETNLSPGFASFRKMSTSRAAMEQALSLFARVRPRSRFGVYARAFDPDLCSSSELTEETGVAAEAITFPGSYYTNPGDAQIVSTFSSR